MPYYVEHNGDCWQSVFPEGEAELSRLHDTIDDAVSYMWEQVGAVHVIVLPRVPGLML